MMSNAVSANAAIRAEARRWFLCLQDNPSRRQQAACHQWRSAHPAHEEAWQAIAAVWQQTAAPGRQLAEQEEAVLSGYLAAMDDRRLRQRSRRRAVSAGALCLMLVMLAGLWLQAPGWLQDLSADAVAAKGERREVVLADGSRVLLDADSAIDVELTPERRRVHLLRGAAFFDVVHDGAPFTVDTAAGSVRVLGTQFDVRLQQDRGVVTLARGSVAVSSRGQPQVTTLVPGQQVTFSQKGIAVPARVNVADAMAWRSGRYVFYHARLGDVVREVERYRTGRIVIASQALADRRVTGSFSLDDSGRALDSLQASVGFDMHRFCPYLVIITQ